VVAMFVPVDVWVMVTLWVELSVMVRGVPVPGVNTFATVVTAGLVVSGCSEFVVAVVWMSGLAIVVLSRGVGLVVGEAVALVGGACVWVLGVGHGGGFSVFFGFLNYCYIASSLSLCRY